MNIPLAHADLGVRRNQFPATVQQFMAQALLGLEAPPSGGVYFVNSVDNSSPSTNTSGGVGDLPERPLPSYGAALRKIDAQAAALGSGFSFDNVVIGLPCHVELVAAASSASSGVHFATAGTRIYQLGSGGKSAGIILGSAAAADVAADINFDAEECYIIGGRIVAGLDNLTAPVDINASNSGLRGVEFDLDAAVADAPTDWVFCGAAVDRAEISNCRLDSTVAGSASVVAIGAALTNMVLEGNSFAANCSGAIVNNVVAAYSRLSNKRNSFFNYNANGATFNRVAGASEVREINGEPWFWDFNAADLSAAGASEVGEHEVFTVAGDIEAKLALRVDEAVASGGALTAQFGVSGATDQIVANTALAALAANTLWHSAAPGASAAILERLVVGGADLGYEILAFAATNGTIVFEALWRPRSGGGKLSAPAIILGAI